MVYENSNVANYHVVNQRNQNSELLKAKHNLPLLEHCQ
uniref:Uncharacterized protein n=1 Tax=Arundo donax TaxID=35708 RepID=A0A0A9FJJ3_ARUDO